MASVVETALLPIMYSPPQPPPQRNKREGNRSKRLRAGKVAERVNGREREGEREREKRERERERERRGRDR